MENMFKWVYVYSRREMLVRALIVYCIEEDEEEGCLRGNKCGGCVVAEMKVRLMEKMTSKEIKRYVEEVMKIREEMRRSIC
jgi:hypothetical protein